MLHCRRVCYSNWHDEDLLNTADINTQCIPQARYSKNKGREHWVEWKVVVTHILPLPDESMPQDSGNKNWRRVLGRMESLFQCISYLCLISVHRKRSTTAARGGAHGDNQCYLAHSCMRTHISCPPTARELQSQTSLVFYAGYSTIYDIISFHPQLKV